VLVIGLLGLAGLGARALHPSAAPVAVTPAPSSQIGALEDTTPLAVGAQAGLLVDLDKGGVLWQRDPQAPRPVASIAKIFTAMETVDLMGWDRPIRVPDAIASLPPDSTMMGLRPGEILTTRELLDGLFLASGNDAALTLAMGAMSEPVFVKGMNSMAARLQLRATHFANPVGLDDPEQHSSAADLAVAARYLTQSYPGLTAIAAMRAIDLKATAGHHAFRLRNLNALLTTYPGTTGLKGGYTGDALGCVIATASRGRHRLLAVVLGSRAAFADSRILLDYGFAALSSGSRR
jgi:D-alanyl-D-alanine carboxypeptidase (penicillin-binding protein 5/6)